MTEEPVPVESAADVPPPAVTVRVIVHRPLCEDGQTYRPSDALETTEPRARRLVELGLVAWPREDARPWWAFWTNRKPGNGRRKKP